VTIPILGPKRVSCFLVGFVVFLLAASWSDMLRTSALGVVLDAIEKVELDKEESGTPLDGEAPEKYKVRLRDKMG
jgi:hypothetical protein